MKIFNLRSLALALAATAAVLTVALGAALLWGGPAQPPAMASINNPFDAVDFSDLPARRHFPAGDGAQLAYRYYAPPAWPVTGSVVLVHGSSGSSNSMHLLAKGFAAAGYATYALDIRGHGDSGTKGQIAYVGQLEDDLAAFTRAVTLAKPSTLAGFSSGGGFVLRFAASPRQEAFQKYLLLSPFLGPFAPTYRPDSGGWVRVGIPRIVALSVLNRVGIHALDDLVVTRFALDDKARAQLTPEYGFALASNFGPLTDYEANIRAVHQPCAVLAGTSDEAFVTDRLEGTFRQQGKNWAVTLLPGVGHIALTLDPVAVRAAVQAVDTL